MVANDHTLLTADKITKGGIFWCFALITSSSSPAPLIRLFKIILNIDLNSQKISKQCDSVMPQMIRKTLTVQFPL